MGIKREAHASVHDSSLLAADYGLGSGRTVNPYDPIDYGLGSGGNSALRNPKASV